MIVSEEFKNGFLTLCRQGKTPTQIAVALDIFKDELIKLSKTDEFKDTWQKGKELYQAYHEDLLDFYMEKDSKIDTKVRDLQRWRLETLFKQDWSAKAEPEIETNKASSLSNEELEERIKNLLNLPHIQQIFS